MRNFKAFAKQVGFMLIDKGSKQQQKAIIYRNLRSIVF